MSSAVLFIANAAMALAALPASPLQQRVASESSRYLKWLNKGVVYIIMDKERAEIPEAATDEQRDQFIQQFWQDRNSPPGRPQTCRKAEHYRRIALANEHFWDGIRHGRLEDGPRTHSHRLRSAG